MEIPSYASIRRVKGELFWVAFGQALAFFGAIVGVRLLTHVLPPAVYGELALGMTVATLVQQVVLSPLSGATLRYFAPALEANQLSAYFGGVRKLLVGTTAVWLVFAGVLSVGLWMSGHGKWLRLTATALMFALLSGYGAVFGGMQNAARQRAVVAWHDGLAVWLRFLTAVALIELLGAFSQVAMFGYALASAAVLVSQFWFFRRRIFALNVAQSAATLDQVQTWKKQMYAYAWPFAIWGMFTWAQIISDRWALQTFTTTSTVGLYAVLYQLGYYPIAILSGSISQLVSPVLFSRAGGGFDPVRMNSTHRLNHLLVLAILGLTGLGTVAAFLLHPLIFSLLAAPEYHGVSSLLPWMVLSGGLFATAQMAVLSLLSATATKSLIAPKIVTAFLGILLNFVGAYTFGLYGVICASVMHSIIYLIWILCLTKATIPFLTNQTGFQL